MHLLHVHCMGHHINLTSHSAAGGSLLFQMLIHIICSDEARTEDGAPAYDFKPFGEQAPPAYNDAVRDKVMEQDVEDEPETTGDRVPLNP